MQTDEIAVFMAKRPESGKRVIEKRGDLKWVMMQFKPINGK
jgi:hypothetical protein